MSLLVLCINGSIPISYKHWLCAALPTWRRLWTVWFGPNWSTWVKHASPQTICSVLKRFKISLLLPSRRGLSKFLLKCQFTLLSKLFCFTAISCWSQAVVWERPQIQSWPLPRCQRPPLCSPLKSAGCHQGEAGGWRAGGWGGALHRPHHNHRGQPRRASHAGMPLLGSLCLIHISFRKKFSDPSFQLSLWPPDVKQ